VEQTRSTSGESSTNKTIRVLSPENQRSLGDQEVLALAKDRLDTSAEQASAAYRNEARKSRLQEAEIEKQFDQRIRDERIRETVPEWYDDYAMRERERLGKLGRPSEDVDHEMRLYQKMLLEQQAKKGFWDNLSTEEATRVGIGAILSSFGSSPEGPNQGLAVLNRAAEDVANRRADQLEKQRGVIASVEERRRLREADIERERLTAKREIAAKIADQLALSVDPVYRKQFLDKTIESTDAVFGPNQETTAPVDVSKGAVADLVKGAPKTAAEDMGSPAAAYGASKASSAGGDGSVTLPPVEVPLRGISVGVQRREIPAAAKVDGSSPGELLRNYNQARQEYESGRRKVSPELTPEQARQVLEAMSPEQARRETNPGASRVDGSSPLDILRSYNRARQEYVSGKSPVPPELTPEQARQVLEAMSPRGASSQPSPRGASSQPSPRGGTAPSRMVEGPPGASSDAADLRFLQEAVKELERRKAQPVTPLDAADRLLRQQIDNLPKSPLRDITQEKAGSKAPPQPPKADRKPLTKEARERILKRLDAEMKRVEKEVR
jgi:hypothetical protein